jgi:hypothetical protein
MAEASAAAEAATDKTADPAKTQATSPSDATKAAPGATSLIADEKADGGADKKIEAHETTIAHKDVEVPNGEKPDYLPDNFWKDGKADIPALAKSYTELRTQFAQGKHKAPKDGKYDLKALGEIPADDPGVKMYTAWAKTHGLSQQAFDDLASQFIELGKSLAPETVDPKAYQAEEMKKLGQHAQALTKGFADWGRGLISKGLLSKDDWDEWKMLGGSAAGVKIMLKLRELIEGPLPLELGEAGEGLPSRDELFAMVGKPEYQTDPAYRAKVEKMFQRAFPQQ